ncbi:YciI family protein [Clostridium sp.]|uniref:YciI family protein n=1 Tax=Clostridium sp. TaxID=1506 RepID=UPI002608F535|nr:YciI family protein [Clostridium sp.]
MKYFLIEGIVTHPEKMTEKMMQEHQDYTELLMKEGKVLFSSLKSDMSASVTVLKAETEQIVQEFYREEPFFKNNILTYSISELQIHYNVSDAESWFHK